MERVRLFSKGSLSGQGKGTSSGGVPASQDGRIEGRISLSSTAPTQETIQKSVSQIVFITEKSHESGLAVAKPEFVIHNATIDRRTDSPGSAPVSSEMLTHIKSVSRSNSQRDAPKTLSRNGSQKEAPKSILRSGSLRASSDQVTPSSDQPPSLPTPKPREPRPLSGLPNRLSSFLDKLTGGRDSLSSSSPMIRLDSLIKSLEFTQPSAQADARDSDVGIKDRKALLVHPILRNSTAETRYSSSRALRPSTVRTDGSEGNSATHLTPHGPKSVGFGSVELLQGKSTNNYFESDVSMAPSSPRQGSFRNGDSNDKLPYAEKSHRQGDNTIEEDDEEEDDEEDQLRSKPLIENGPTSLAKSNLSSMESGLSHGTNRQSHASSKNSSNLPDEDTMMGKFIRAWRKWEVALLESEQYAFYRRTVDDSRNQILVVAFGLALVYGSILYVIQGVLGTVLPAIRFYNLIHVIVAFQGKLVLGVGWKLSHLVQKGFAALEISNHKRGAPMTSLAQVDPKACRLIIRIFKFTMFAVELSLWALSFSMDWEPEDTYLGTFACNALTFNKPFNFTNELQTWVGANSEFALLGVYGLPLTSGIVGGNCATPTRAPSTQFEMKGPAIIYLVNTVCVNATVSPGPPSNQTMSKITTSQYLGSMYTFTVQLTFPAGLHSWTQYNSHDLIQSCQTNVVTGTGKMSFGYSADDWLSSGSIVASSINEINIGDGIVITNDNSNSFDFGMIHYALDTTEETYMNITKWIAQGVYTLLDNDNLVPIVTRAPYAQILNWGVNTNGLYDPTLTWKGIATAVGIIGHYVMDQNDGNSQTVCDYNGTAGYGKIAAPTWMVTVAIIVLICSAVIAVAVVFSWLLIVGGGPHIDKCVQMIDDPLRTLYYMRNSAEHLVTKIRGNDIGRISLQQHLKKVMIRFGEDKKTRGSDVGTIIVDEPSKVVKITKKRKMA
ncbi:hypothetical protein HDU79_002210 [Rhizoclosmatium sp. JEL0117]|nr:hypothetical protein HDU79_002210 [Rhizoclosmatium sp. JEL0117]